MSIHSLAEVGSEHVNSCKIKKKGVKFHLFSFIFWYFFFTFSNAFKLLSLRKLWEQENMKWNLFDLGKCESIIWFPYHVFFYYSTTWEDSSLKDIVYTGNMKKNDMTFVASTRTVG